MGGGPGHFCCHVWCPGGGWLEGRAQLAPFSLHEVPATSCGLCSRAIRLLSQWLKTLRESVPRHPGKSSEASEELTSEALGCPFCHILLSGRSLDQSRVKKRGKTFLLNGGQLQPAVFQLVEKTRKNWFFQLVFQNQMFFNYMAFHMGPWNLGASLFL